MATQAEISDFVNKITPVANQIGGQYGIDPRVIIAQAALETGYGTKVSGNNYFGIKGPGQVLSTREQGPNGLYSTQQSFRSYPSLDASVQDWANLVARRYPGVAGASPSAAFGALKAGGYASDDSYVPKLNDTLATLGRSSGSQPQGLPMMSAYAPSQLQSAPQAAINAAAPPQGLAALSAPSAPPGFNPQAADRMITGEFNQLQPTAVAQQPAAPNFGQALSSGIGGALKALGGQASPTGLAGLSPKAYTGAGGILIPLLAMNGQSRNTYGDVANGLGLSSLVNGV
jgi:hypothetical protein